MKKKVVNSDAHELIKNIEFNVKQSLLTLSTTDSKLKDRALMLIAKRIVRQKDFIQSQKKLDVEGAKDKGLTGALLGRLVLNEKRIVKPEVKG